jgi:hypothetical protein
MNTILGYALKQNKKQPLASSKFISKNTSGQNYFQAIYYGRNDYPPKVREIMSQFGSKKIMRMEVRRTPLGKVLTAVLDITTFYQIERNNPYDELYHLHLAVMLDDGTTITIEKNEVISMEINPPPRENTEYREVNLQSEATVGYHQFFNINDLMSRTKDRMGQNFFIYSARNCNCQDFILNILQANGLNTPELETFIKQDAIRIFGDMVRFRKFSNTVTDFAGRLNVVTEGAGSTFKVLPTVASLGANKNKGVGLTPFFFTKLKKMEPNSFHNALSNIDIEDILRDKPVNFGGVYSKDKIPKELKKDYWYIINMENENDGDGSHWVCFKYGDNIEYYDAFGFIPPNSIMELAKKDIFYSDKQIQDDKSTACGWFCIARITSHLPYMKFINQFSNNTKENDIILKEMLEENGIID